MTASRPRRAATARRAPPPREAALAPALDLPDPRAALLLLLALGAVVLSVGTQLFDTDLWQHLAVGRAVWTLKRVPTTQLWVWPLYGQPDVDYAWGFEALLWPFWSLGGVAGLYLWRALTTLLAFALTALVARRLGARDLALWIVIALAAVMHRERAFIRPESLADLLLVLDLLVLEAWRRGGARRAVWAIVPIQWAWANVHISWPLGFLILGVYELDARLGGGAPRRTLLPVIGAALAASFLNPFGARGLLPPFRYLFTQRHSALYRRIDELQPLQWRDLVRTWGAGFVLGWPLLLAWRWRRFGLDRVELMLSAGFTALAVYGVRYLGPYTMVAVPFVARDLDAWLRSRSWDWLRAAGSRTAIAAASILVIAALGILRPSLSGTWTPFGLEIQWRRVPVQACDFIASRGIRGHAFNTFDLGGYLLYRFWPDRDRLPFLDIHQAGTEQDLNDYVAMLEDPAAWRALDARRRFEWALVQTPDQADALDADTSFVPVFREDAAVLYVRREGPLAAIARRDAYRVLPGGNVALDRIRERARADTALAAALERDTRRAVAESRHDGNALNLLSMLDVRAGRLDDAREHLARAAQVLPALPHAQERLGALALATGHPRDALDAFERERRRSGSSARLAIGMGSAWRALGDVARARDAFRRAAALDPGSGAADSLGALETPHAR